MKIKKRPTHSLSPFPRETYEQNALIYKILANPKRLEILNTLKKRELTVDDLSDALKSRKSNISQHLMILRLHCLVKTRRAGRNIFYTILDPRIVEPCKILHHFWRRKA